MIVKMFLWLKICIGFFRYKKSNVFKNPMVWAKLQPSSGESDKNFTKRVNI